MIHIVSFPKGSIAHSWVIVWLLALDHIYVCCCEVKNAMQLDEQMQCIGEISITLALPEDAIVLAAHNENIKLQVYTLYICSRRYTYIVEGWKEFVRQGISKLHVPHITTSPVRACCIYIQTYIVVYINI